VAQDIEVANRGDGALPITMNASGFVPAGTQGGADLSDDATGVVDWTSVSPKEFVLEPGQKQTVTFLITIPANETPGGHYLSILSSLGSESAQGGEGGAVTVGQRIGSLVLLRVAGEVIEDLSVTSFSAPSLAAKGPIEFKLLDKNEGTVHVRPAGQITITNTFGSEVAQIGLDAQNVLPDSEREFVAVWDTGWTIGLFTAEYVAVYGSDGSVAKASTTVIIFPWPIATPVLVLILGLALVIIKGRRRLSRTFGVLFGGEA